MDYIKAFVVGGLFCVVAQILMDKTKLTPARILVIYVVAGVVLSAFSLYKPLVDYSGAGATVPISGFGYVLARGVERAVDKDGLLGVISGGTAGAAAGLGAVIIFGFLIALIFKSKDKS